MVTPTSSSLLPTSPMEHEVFLSFSEETRNNFTCFLREKLRDKGINTFMEEAERPESSSTTGDEISPAVAKAVEISKISVVVFSPNYASSKLCLNELAKIAECKKNNDLQHTVLPVFCNVTPSHLRKQLQEKEFRKALIEKYNQGLVEKWSAAQTEACNVSGWDLENRDYANVIQNIVELILSLLDRRSSGYDNGYVGMASHIKKMMLYLDKEPDEVRTIGMWGPGGIGKTAIAEEIYETIGPRFESSAFLSDVSNECKNHSLIYLQEVLCERLFGVKVKISYVGMGMNYLMRRLCSTKVLIILDDVTELKQIEALVGKAEDQHRWFCRGSRIILTTRDKLILKRYCGNNIYEVEKLRKQEALQLFHQNAFDDQNPPSHELTVLSRYVVNFADSLPLALKVLGSLLCGESIDVWLDVRRHLKRKSSESSEESEKCKIYDILQLGYDRLKEYEYKQIFLDIACFFKGEEEYRVKKILESSDFYPTIGIKVLTDKALITVQEGKIWMHHLLQEIGWNIVHEESPNKPRKRSRLWLYTDARDVLMENKGKEMVQGIFLRSPAEEKLDLKSDPFVNMKNLRLLKICNVNLTPCSGYDFVGELRLLEWHGYPLNSMPPNFRPHKLVELSMPNSHIEQLWNETTLCEKLILMNFSNCHQLIKSPDFSQFPNLEKLILEGCKTLSYIHPSIGGLQRLLLLNLKGCESLHRLPNDISLKSLRTLILSGCSELEEFPDIVGDMKNLSELFCDGTAIRKLPISMKYLDGLLLLNLNNCKHLLSLPGEIIFNLRFLQELSLSGCLHIDQLPEDIGSLENLKKLFVDGTSLKKVPSSIQFLKNLEFLSFRGCKGLQLLDSFSGLSSLISLDLSQCDLPEGAVPDDIGYFLSSLEKLQLSENKFSSVPESISQLSKLRELNLSKCNELQSLPKDLPLCLKYLYANDCRMLRSDGLEVWSSDSMGFHFIDCRKSSGSDEDSTRLAQLPMSEDHLDTLFPEFIKGLVNDEKLFEIHFPYKIIPQWCSMWSPGSSVTIEFSADNNFSARKGLALFVVVKIEEHEHLEESLKGKKTHFTFHVDGVHINRPFFLRNIEHLKGGAFGICCYIPRQRSARRLDEAIQSIGASFSTERPDVEIEMCGIREIFEEDVEMFSEELAQTANEHLELVLNFCRHCKYLLDKANILESTGDVMSIPCDPPKVQRTSTDSPCEEKNSSTPGDANSSMIQEIKLDLLKLFEGHSARKRMFAFTVPRRIISPWFFHHSMGDIGVCYLPPNLYNDASWLGVELYVTFKLPGCISESRRFTASLEIYLYGHGSTTFPLLRSENYWVQGGSGGGLVIYFHIPREFFPEQLNQCDGISIFFRFINPEVRVEFCGTELLFEANTEILIQAIIESAKVADGLPFLLEQAKLYLGGTEPSCSTLCSSHTYLREEIGSLQKLLTGTGREATEVRAKMQEYRNYLANKMGIKEFDPIIVHSKSYFCDMWESEKEKTASLKEPSITYDFNHLHVMAETLHKLSDSGNWKENFEFVLQQLFKPTVLITLTVKGHLISTIKHFDPWSTYNLCFPPHKKVLPWIEDHETICNTGSTATIILPSNLCSDNNWKGLVICAEFSVHEHPTAFSEMSFKLLCHLTSNGRCLNPASMYSFTKEKFKWLYLRGFIWLTYIPSILLMEQLNGENQVEAKIYNNSIGPIVKKCGIRLLYKDDVEKFRQTIIHCCTSFFDDLDPMIDFISRHESESQCHAKSRERTAASGNMDRNTATRHDDHHCEDIHGTLGEDVTIVPSIEGGSWNVGIPHRGHHRDLN